ncbi:hypothetical protein RYZ26_05995 [Terasakiella sp. A23]|uniref:hypothetical protein n=1 Tax=Terasakiella sp. FCG-A23 TaxID=3080561 RepID=UPI002953F3E2|nr:hypothetical protein [Terasakiella sp. A23]MDV7339134.1 hypothetical protein [Terasakiella sp. A23]
MIARFLFLFCLSFSLLKPAHALEVTAQGTTQRQALNNALRQAVEMKLGTGIEANTLVENFQVVRQQILSHTQGYVKSYKVVKEASLSNGGYEITIDADVDDKSLKDSTRALSTLMKMAAHPRVMVAGIHEDFDAVSSLNDGFRQVREMVEQTFREDFHFDIIDLEASRLSGKDTYRHHDRKNHLKRARKSGADYLVFVEMIKAPAAPYKIRLESIEVATNRSLAREEAIFAHISWSKGDEAALRKAKDHIYIPSIQIAVTLVENIKKEVYEDGQRYELSFYKFDEKTVRYLEADLAALPGYVRHKITGQKKNALSLSYWSMLKAGALNEEISALLKRADVPFDFHLRTRTLTYRFDDPMFE